MAYATDAIASQVDVRTQSGLSWKAVFGGWVVATGIAFLLYVAGLAVGLEAFNPYNASASAKGIGAGTAVWMVVTWAVALFLGGVFASWFDGMADRTSGALHGLTVWGLSIVITLALVALGTTQLMQGGASAVRGAASVGGAAASRAEEATTGIQAQLTQRIVNTIAGSGANQGNQVAGSGPSATDVRRAAEQLDRPTMAAVAGAMLKGDPEHAKALLSASTSLSDAEIDHALQSVTAQVEQYKAKAQAAADRAAHYTALAMWLVFLSSLIAMMAAAIGGWLGAGHTQQRISHMHRFETATASPL